MDSYAQLNLSIVSLTGSQFGNTSEECLSGDVNLLGCGWLAPWSLGGIDVGVNVVSLCSNDAACVLPQ